MKGRPQERIGTLVAAIETIEAFGFKTAPDGEVWSKAQAIRCRFLLEEAATLKAASQWMDVLAKLDFIRRLQKEFKLNLATAVVKPLEALESWARGEQEAGSGAGALSASPPRK